MAYYYVKSGGTAGNTNAGRTTTARTGAWSGSTGDYYDNIDEVFGIAAGSGTTPGNGDFIFVSHLHTHSISVSTYGVEKNGSDDIINLISVDDSNQDRYKAGASETRTGNMVVYPRMHMYGVTITTTSYVQIANEQYIRGGGGISSSGSTLWPVVDNVVYEGATLTLDDGIRFISGPIRMIGCTVSGTHTSICNSASEPLRGSLLQCDFSGFTSATSCFPFGSSTQRYRFVVRDTKLPSGVPLSNGSDINYEDASILITNSAGTSGEQEYQWFFKDWAGETEHNTSNYRDDTTAFPVSSQKISLVTDTTTQAVADIGRVHSFDFFTRYARLSSSDYDTITIYLSCDDALTDSEVWVDVYYPDGTNRHQPNQVSTRAPDILGSGTALTSDSSTWTGGGTNKYKIVISTSSDPGGDCVPTIKVNVATQSLIYWDPVPELS